MSEIPSIYKPWISQSAGYSGGKSINEINTTADKIYKLSSNENLLGSSPKALAAIKASIQDLNIYPDGKPLRLQKALSQFYKNQLTPDQFIIGNGGSEIIDILIRGFADSHTECIVSNPCFSPYVMFSEWSAAKVVDVPLLSPDYRLDVGGILSAINERTRIIFLTSPNNPTGTYIRSSEMDQLLASIPDHIVVVYDEVYYHFADAPDYFTAVDYVSKGHNVIAINSFSKTYGLAALRLGYAYSTPAIARYLDKLCRPFYVNSININAGIAALEDVSFVSDTVAHVQSERTRIYEALEHLRIRYWRSQANFIMIQSPDSSIDLMDHMTNMGIMLRPAFGTTDCVRITIGSQEANDAMLDALSQFM